MIKVSSIACRSDNYAYVVECAASGESALVDASLAAPVLEGLGGRKVGAVWATHHHPDHVDGNVEVVTAMGGKIPVLGHASDKGRIPGQTRFLEEGESFQLGKLAVSILHIPGHTTGAIAYVVTDPDGDTVVFTGDTLFIAGCGRLFEGTPAMMHTSLAKLAKLPGKTRVYCGHEYTEANLAFAKHAEPANRDIAAAVEKARGLRAAGKTTMGGTMADELLTNPFLRVDEPALRKTLGIAESASSADALGVVREAKNVFKG